MYIYIITLAFYFIIIFYIFSLSSLNPFSLFAPDSLSGRLSLSSLIQPKTNPS